ASITEYYFNSLHAVLADANAIVQGLQGETAFTDPVKAESMARFGQGASLGNLALVFDRVFASDETGTLNDGEPLPYQEAIELSVRKLELAIAGANDGDFTVSDNIVYGKTLSSAQWSQFLDTCAARLMVMSGRNAEQRGNLYWNRVLGYTQG